MVISFSPAQTGTANCHGGIQHERDGLFHLLLVDCHQYECDSPFIRFNRVRGEDNMTDGKDNGPDALLSALVAIYNEETKIAKAQNSDSDGKDIFGDVEEQANQFIDEADAALGTGNTTLAESLLRKAIQLVEELDGDFSLTSAYDAACDALDYLEDGDIAGAKEAMPASDFKIIRHRTPSRDAPH